ncbi:MAG: SH3-like domain-containing protein [Cyclobacteriaceae bacterium]
MITSILQSRKENMENMKLNQSINGFLQQASRFVNREAKSKESNLSHIDHLSCRPESVEGLPHLNLSTIRNAACMLFAFVIITSCSQKPKVIEAEAQPDASDVFEFKEPYIDVDELRADAQPSASDVHKVKVLETLPTEKYSYLRVEENGRKYWIATKKMEVKVGGTYFYSKGLLKTDFKSKEYNRTFDSLYLVSQVVPASHGQKTSDQGGTSNKETTPTVQPTYSPSEGYLSIKELAENPEKYANQLVSLKGVCTKINANIMGRNWIHLKDGSKDDFDLVITSTVNVPVGHTLAIKGKVTLKKDFGSGYYYDLIVEEGELIQEKGS